MERSLIRRIAWPSFLFVALVSFLYYIFKVQPIAIITRGTELITSYEFSFLFMPMLIIFGSIYASFLIRILLRGKLAEAIGSVLLVGSLPWALLWLSRWTGYPGQLENPTIALFEVASLLQGRILVRTLSGVYEKWVNPSYDCSMYAAVGLVLSSTSEVVLGSTQFLYLAPSISAVVKLTFIATGISSFFGIFKDMGWVLSWVSAKVSDGLFSKFVMYLMVFFYIFVVRGRVAAWLGFQQTYLTVLEWIFFSGVVYALFRSYKKYTRESLVTFKQEEFWSRHAQKIDWFTDYRMNMVSESIKVFVDGGGREMIMTHLFQVMSEYKDRSGRIAEIISPLANYRDLESRLIIFSWQVNLIEGENHRRRRKALDEVMGRLDSFLIDVEKSSESLVEAQSQVVKK